MRQTIFSYAQAQLESAEILPEYSYHKDGAEVAPEPLKESISKNTFYDLVGIDAGSGNEYIRFSLQFSRGHFSVNSNETVLRGNSALWERK
jgi:hypothetical protein